jgi:hypothetical protein
MPQEKKETDSLEGYRGRDQYDAMEDEVRSFRALADSNVNVELLQQVLVSDNLVAELKNESSTLKRLVNHVLTLVDDAFKTWQLASDPTDAAAVGAHRDAAAARLLLDWIALEVHKGQEAQELLEEEYDEREQT